MSSKEVLEQRIRDLRSAVLVVNTHSRRGERFFQAALDAFARRGLSIGASYSVRDPARLPDTVKEAIASGSPLVIVGGGDGTISSVVDHFAYQDVVLGILPLGTGNSFARTLGIPIPLDNAIDVITSGKVVDVDLGKVGADYFANVATIGFSAEVAHRASRRLKRYLGVLAYVLVGARIIFSHRSFLCRLTVAETAEVIRTHQVVIANGSFFGIRKLAAEAGADDRQLTIFTMADLNRWRMIRAWVDVLRGKRAGPSAGRYLATQAITIEADPQQYIDVDGELITRTPAEFRVAAEALMVMVPKAFRDV
jgi:YegS/Rv2252/BmrU family lipid kinase